MNRHILTELLHKKEVQRGARGEKLPGRNTEMLPQCVWMGLGNQSSDGMEIHEQCEGQAYLQQKGS